MANLFRGCAVAAPKLLPPQRCLFGRPGQHYSLSFAKATPALGSSNPCRPDLRRCRWQTLCPFLQVHLGPSWVGIVEVSWRCQHAQICAVLAVPFSQRGDELDRFAICCPGMTSESLAASFSRGCSAGIGETTPARATGAAELLPEGRRMLYQAA